MNTVTLYTPPDIDAAYDEWGANCGPAALAALLGKPLADVRPHLAGYDGRRGGRRCHRDSETGCPCGRDVVRSHRVATERRRPRLGRTDRRERDRMSDQPSTQWYEAGVQELNIQHGDRLIVPGELYDRLCAALAAAEAAYVAMPPLPDEDAAEPNTFNARRRADRTNVSTTAIEKPAENRIEVYKSVCVSRVVDVVIDVTEEVKAEAENIVAKRLKEMEKRPTATAVVDIDAAILAVIRLQNAAKGEGLPHVPARAALELLLKHVGSDALTREVHRVLI